MSVQRAATFLLIHGLLWCLFTISVEESLDGCTAPFFLPKKPFVVVWNHPSSTCRKHGIKLDFAKWGIVDNYEDHFMGSEMSLFYSLGKWPYYNGKKEPVYGGLPQLGNLFYHLDHAEQYVKAVTEASFSGLGVIDFENWRPKLSLNFDSLRIYQTESVALARKRFPHYNNTQVHEEATREFDFASRLFMETTLLKVHQLRPDGKWGYYGYPRCWDPNCNHTTIAVNDYISWVFAKSSGLYPRIYFSLRVKPKNREVYVKQNVREALRVKAKFGTPEMPIFPYAFCQDSAYEFYNRSDIYYSIGLPADVGSSGVVLWGSSSLYRKKDECILLQKYLNSTLGPYAKQVTEFFENCSIQLCSSHGRCVKKDMEAIYQSFLEAKDDNLCKISYKKLMTTSRGNEWKDMDFEHERHSAKGSRQFENYVCKCLKGWKGDHCDHKMP